MFQFRWQTARHSIAPLTLIITTTCIAPLLALLPLESGISSMEMRMFLGNTTSWLWAFAFMAWGIVSLHLPSKVYYGPPDEFGYRPKYSANGTMFYTLTVLGFLALNAWRPSISLSLYDNAPQLYSSLLATAYPLCLYFWWKGKYRPQNEKPKVEGNFSFIFQFYRGMEVHLRILGMDVKQLIVCRIGVIMWQVLILAFMFTSFQRTGFNSGILVNVALQSIYLAKFYAWETGYFNTLDITLDRAGYYICWGSMVFVPSFYTFSTYYFVSHPPVTSNATNVIILALGILSLHIKYLIDYEKTSFHETDGKCEIWGKLATYISIDDPSHNGINMKKKQLLVSGFWGVARHINYTFELLSALLWNLPGWNLGIMPFFYNVYLTILLVHRIYRDEDKCRTKYGKAWQEYCKKVPFRLIPGVY